jgi:hypothetical protein
MFLESNGIWASLQDEHVAQLFWHYTTALGGVRVAVADENAEEASRLYTEYMATIRSGPNLVKPVRFWPVVALISLAVGIPVLLFGRRESERKDLDSKP